MSVRVGILDSGIGADFADRIAASRPFAAEADDLSGHGHEIARIVLALAPGAMLLDARIFGRRLATDAATATAGLLWLVEAGARLVAMSFGLREDRPVLAEACRAADRAGTVLIASSPSRGLPTYPASYPAVIRVCGDARCAGEAVSALYGEPADFGACPRPWNAGAGDSRGGSSYAAAYVTGIAAR